MHGSGPHGCSRCSRRITSTLRMSFGRWTRRRSGSGPRMSHELAAEPRQLSRAISGSEFFALGFGTIIGVGWVIVLGDWLRQAGPLGAMLAFVAGGLVMVVVG